MNKYDWGFVILAILIWITFFIAVAAYDMCLETEPEPNIPEIIRQEIQTEIAPLKEADRELKEEMKKWLEEWGVTEKEASFYAPLDPSAVENMCFSGNPNITASGAQVEIGTTIAAGAGIPFGTEMYIQNFGWRIVEDRGSMIGEGQVDIAVEDRKTALKLGRQRLTVVSRRGS